MKRHFLFPLLLTLCLTGCQSANNTPTLSSVENVFRSVTVTLPDTATTFNDNLYILPATENTPAQVGVLYYDTYQPGAEYDTVLFTVELSAETETPVTHTTVLPAKQDGGRISGYAAAADGSYYVTEMVPGHNTFLYHLSSDGNVLSMADLAAYGTMEWAVDMVVDRDGQLVLAGEKMLLVFDESCTLVHSVSFSGVLVHMESNNDDGILVCTDTMSGDGTGEFMLLDGQLTEIEPVSMELDMPTYTEIAGIYGYDRVVWNKHGVYGRDGETGETVELCSFVNSDISSSGIQHVKMISSDLLVYRDTGGAEERLSLAIRIPQDEVVPKILVTVQINGLDREMDAAAVAFNRQSDTYRVVFDDYARYHSETDAFAASVQLDKTIAAGTDTPDIFTLTDDIYRKYADKGVFCDLYPWMDADETFSRDALLSCVLEPMAYRGELYRLTTRFRLQTIAAAESICTAYEPWTLEAFLAFAESRQQPILESYTRRELVLLFFDYGIGSFIDEGGVHFTDGRAARVLALLERYGENDFIELTSDERKAKIAAAPERYQTGDALYTNGYAIYDTTEYWQMYAMYEDTPFGIIGYPGVKGGETYVVPERSFAISAESPVKEGAWAFLTFLLAEEPTYGISGYSSLRTQFTAQLGREREMLYYYDPTNPYRHVNTAGVNAAEWLRERGFVQLTIPDTGWDSFTALVENAVCPPILYPEITDIVQEELDVYFSGGQSAEKTLDNMQKRAELVWAERR